MSRAYSQDLRKRVLGAVLAGRKYLMGERKTVADAYLYPMASWAFDLPKPVSAYPNIHAFMARMVQDPAVLEGARAAGHGAEDRPGDAFRPESGRNGLSAGPPMPYVRG